MSTFRKSTAASRAAEQDRVSKMQSEMRRQDAYTAAKRYEAARYAATGEAVEVRYTNGWFRFNCAMYRRADLIRMAGVLEARAAALSNPDEESC